MRGKMIPLVTNLLAYATGFRVAHQAIYSRWKRGHDGILQRFASVILHKMGRIDRAVWREVFAGVDGSMYPGERRPLAQISGICQLET